MAKSRKTPKKKTSIGFTHKQEAFAKARAEREDITFAEAVRRIIDERIAKEKWREPDGEPVKGTEHAGK